MSPEVPVVVVASLDPVGRAAFCGGLLLDLDRGVVIQHDLRFGPTGGGVRRVVTDRSGVVYDDDRQLGHTCLACAVREDLVPTIAQLAADGRWRVVVVALPVTADPQTVVSALSQAVEQDELGPARLACVVALADAETLIDDLFGDDLLVERGLALGQIDRRSVGEALACQLESADVVGLAGPVRATTSDLVPRIARAAQHVRGWTEITGASLVTRRLDRTTARRRSDALDLLGPTLPDTERAWSLRLRTARPFHPVRLRQQIEDLGAGRVRARGHFWLPTRPDQICVWDGAGGQLSIGPYGWWSGRTPSTHLVVVGIDAADRDRIAAAFGEVVMTPVEARRIDGWLGRDDGFGPWLDAARPWAA